ncbi:MAG: ferrous iron transport protein A [Defluviitaleaceae bacterium]|nr:ferrous iron transport protein A [Defluviitaleaceae bacterium]
MNSLMDMKVGDVAFVANINLDGAIYQRLGDLGITPGTKIECVQKSPLGDPVAYMVRGAVIALRSETAAGVLVTPEVSP